jgi:hypothetical protein
MDTGNDMTAPQSVAQVEELIERLYKPGSGTQAQRISDQLIQLQRSPDAWNLADGLMSSNDANVRFNAAIMFTAKLNNEGSVFDPELSPW